MVEILMGVNLMMLIYPCKDLDLVSFQNLLVSVIGHLTKKVYLGLNNTPVVRPHDKDT